MTILSSQTIKSMVLNEENYFQIEPFFQEKQLFQGMSYGLSSAGYDFRLSLNGVTGIVDGCYTMQPRENLLASILEYIKIPSNIIATFENKSSLIRQFVTVHNTVFEPNWEGYATLEISNLNDFPFKLYHGQPIGQALFHLLDEPTETPYNGKYQNQINEPVKAIMERKHDH